MIIGYFVLELLKIIKQYKFEKKKHEKILICINTIIKNIFINSK